MDKMKKDKINLINIESVLGGLAVGLGALAYTLIYDGSFLSNVVAAFGFGIMLLAVQFYDLDLFVGRAGLLSDKNKDPFEMLLIFAGNFIGVTWLALMLKLIPEYHQQLYETSHVALQFWHSERWDTVFILSIFCGMMMYAGTIAYKRSNNWVFFVASVMVIVLARWPFAPVMIFRMWLDNWDYWYLIIPTVLGNVIGANIWGTLRMRSKRYHNVLKRDSYDIGDKFHDFV